MSNTMFMYKRFINQSVLSSGVIRKKTISIINAGQKSYKRKALDTTYLFEPMHF